MRISRKKRPEKPMIPHYNVNEAIQSPTVRVLDAEGNNLGIVDTKEAIARARGEELDLVEINPKAEPPVAQMIAFTHFKYQKEKEVRKQKINSRGSELKGVRLSIRIGEHDMDVRLDQAAGFLERGDKVKAEIILRGREMKYAGQAFDVIRKFFSLLNAKMPVRFEQDPIRQGNKITAIIIRG